MVSGLISLRWTEGWPRGQTWSVCGGQSCSIVGSALRSVSEESGLFTLVSEAVVVQLVVSIMCWHSPKFWN